MSQTSLGGVVFYPYKYHMYAYVWVNGISPYNVCVREAVQHAF